MFCVRRVRTVRDTCRDWHNLLRSARALLVLRQSLVSVGQDFRAKHTVRHASRVHSGILFFLLWALLVGHSSGPSELAAYRATSVEVTHTDIIRCVLPLRSPGPLRLLSVGGWGVGTGGDGRCF